MNFDTYTSEMAKSVWDKSFFMDKIPGVKLVIDFGCADGAMIRMLAPLFPQTTFYGYDFNDVLIDTAWQRLSAEASRNTFFFRVKRNYQAFKDGFDDMIQMAKDFYKPEEICINFSSVLHEVFSSSQSGKAAIKRLITELKPKYITIRDMYFHEGDNRRGMRYVLGPVDIVNKCQPHLKDFESIYGSTKEAKNLIHFLMKYQWKNNGWETELNENYFAWTIEDFEQLVEYNYTVVFENYYQLPFLTESWKEMFFLPNLHTHAQFILRRDD